MSEASRMTEAPPLTITRRYRHGYQRVQRWCTTSPQRISFLLGALLGLVGVAKYGIAMWPGWPNLYAAAVNWSDPLTSSVLAPPQDYVLSSSIVSLGLGVLNLTSQNIYVSAYVLLALTAVVVPFLAPRSLHSVKLARLLYLMLAGGPLLVLLLTGIGGYDALSIVAMSVAVLSRNVIAVSAAWFVVGLNHSALALLALTVWALVLLAESDKADGGETRKRLMAIGSSFSAVLFGSVLMWLLTQQWGGITGRWEVYRLYDFGYYANMLMAGMPLLLFSALGAGWLVLLDRSVRAQRTTRVVLGLALLLSFTLPLLAVDQTRVVAITLYPAVLLWARRMSERCTDHQVKRLWRRWAIPATIIPVIIIWEGAPDPGTWQNILNWRASFL